jgi:hypothetical protein
MSLRKEGFFMSKYLQKLGRLRHVRMLLCVAMAAALLLVVALLAEQQVPVILYKGALLMLGAVSGYVIDALTFSWAAPEGYLERDWRDTVDEEDYSDGISDFPVVSGDYLLFIVACARRAFLVAVGTIVMGGAM